MICPDRDNFSLCTATDTVLVSSQGTKKLSVTVMENKLKDRGRVVFLVFYYSGFIILFPYMMLLTVTDFWNYKVKSNILHIGF